MTKIFIKPKIPGNIVRNFQRSDMRAVPQEGEWVVDCPQWRRYLKAGDIVITEPSKDAVDSTPKFSPRPKKKNKTEKELKPTEENQDA